MKRSIKTVFLVLLVAGVVVAVRFEERISRDQQLERDLRIRTGGNTSEDVRDVVQALMAEGVPHDDAVDVGVALSVRGHDALDDMEMARLLANLEQNASADFSPSRELVRVAEGLGVDSDGLSSFVKFVALESTQRKMPVESLVAGVREHGLEYATGCELLEQSPCPLDVVVRLVLDRQQAEYERWGHVDCGLFTNTAHPGCLTFADCAQEYALMLAAQDADLDALQISKALGHEPGSSGWEEWTAMTGEAALASWESHETCVDERYGEGVDAYKALVLTR